MNEASLEQLESSLRGHESLSVVDDFNGLTKKYIEYGETIKSLQGELEGKVAIPGDDAPEDQRKSFLSKIGVPESHDKYTYAKPESIPEGITYNEARLQEMKKLAHDAGISDKAFTQVAKALDEKAIADQLTLQAKIKELEEKDTNALKDIWKGDAFTANTEKANRALDKFLKNINVPESFGGIEGIKEELDILGFGKNNPKLTYFMSEVFNLIGDDTLPDNNSSGDSLEPGSEEAHRKYLAEKYPEMAKT